MLKPYSLFKILFNLDRLLDFSWVLKTIQLLSTGTFSYYCIYLFDYVYLIINYIRSNLQNQFEFNYKSINGGTTEHCYCKFLQITMFTIVHQIMNGLTWTRFI